ncbi:hypothetical protein RS030_213339 [Cryptosporidium xiaoi]|uniref:RPAP1 C-terminal domain-containing protein n=1 Tax=Cryptosporidium xiaoi TaxID=659607 RepID=A0AAV9XXS8_9CRYT
MNSNENSDNYKVIEEVIVEDEIKKYAEYLELNKAKHPNLGFPKAVRRNANNNGKPSIHSSFSKGDNRHEFKSEVGSVSNSSFDFNFTVNDLLKLRWTNPIGEDESDFLDQKKTDVNLHSLRFNFEGCVCDNRNIEEKSEKDHLHYYKGLHHHSEQGDHEGYTIPELMHLSKSSNVSQRCISVRTLGNIFLKIRQYIVIEREHGKIYNEHLLGYLYGIHRWYRYLTEDLSIHYLILNILFHDLFVSRAAEYSVISLCNLLCGSFYNYHYNLTLKQDKYSLLLLFLLPSEFVFEMMNNMVDCYPYHYRNNIIYQNIDFIQKYQRCNGNVNNDTGYFDLEMEEHLINFELPDGKKIELLRDTLQEVYQFKPVRYDFEIESQRNSLIHFLSKISQTKNASLDSRISSIRLMSLFVQRGCVNDKRLCFSTFNEMLTSIGDELFDFTSTLFMSNNDKNKISDLLLSYLILIRMYIQSIYNSKNNIQVENNIHIRKSELYDLLVNSTLQIIRSVLLFVLTSSSNESENNIYSSIQLSSVEGIRIIELMVVNNIYIEDLSIYCKELIHFLTLLKPNNPINSYLVYHFYMLGYYVITYDSKNNYIHQEHLQFVQVLNQFIPKLCQKFVAALKSEGSTLFFNSLLVTISNLRFFNASITGNTGFDTFNDEIFTIFSDYHILIDEHLSEIDLTEFDSKIISIESGSLLGIELGLTSIGDLLYNNEFYCKYYSIILVTTYLKEISNSLLLYNKINNYKKYIVEKINSNYFRLLLDFSLEQFSKYISHEYGKSLDNEDLVKLNSEQLYNYDYSYFEILSIYDNQLLVYNNKLVKNSEFIQVLCYNTLYVLILCLFGNSNKSYDNFGLCSTSNMPLNTNNNCITSNILIVLFKFNDFDFSFRFDEVKNYLLVLLFNCKTIQEYTIIAYWLLKAVNNNVGDFGEFYETLFDEYSKYIEVSCGIFVFNPFIYTINILFTLIGSEGDEFSVKKVSSGLLFGLLKDIFSIEFKDELKKYISKYLFEYSINQMLCLSKSEHKPNTKSLGEFILTLLKLSIGFTGCNVDIDMEFEDVLNLFSKKQTYDSKNKYIQNIYDLSHNEDNKYIEKLIETLISSFCDSNLFFEEAVLDCYYFTFLYLLQMLIMNSEYQYRILSNQKILKFLLFHDNKDINVGRIITNNLNVIFSEKKQSFDCISAKKVNEIIYNSIKTYKKDINKNVLLTLLFIYSLNSNYHDSLNFEEDIRFLQELKSDS